MHKYNELYVNLRYYCLLPKHSNSPTFLHQSLKTISNQFFPQCKQLIAEETKSLHHYHTTTVLRPFFRDYPGELVPEENFWTLWCKGRLTEADTLTIQLGTTPSGLTSAHIHYPPIFLQVRCPSCHQTNSVKALKATNYM